MKTAARWSTRRSWRGSALTLAPMLAATLATASAGGAQPGEGWRDGRRAEHTPQLVTATDQAWIHAVGIRPNSGAQRIVMPYLKAKPGKLDGAIRQVGFENQQRITQRGRTLITDWRELRPAAHYGTDYFGFEIPVGSDYHTATVTGRFVVETNRGTRYLIRSRDANGRPSDFVFDDFAFDNILWLKAGNQDWKTNWGPSAALPTLGNGAFGAYYNPLQIQ